MFYILPYVFAALLLWMILLTGRVRRHGVNVVLFSLLVITGYTILGNIIPQIESRPPQELQLAESTSPAQLARVGERIFYGKGTCALCHSIEPSEAARCPQLGAGPLGPAIGARAEG